MKGRETKNCFVIMPISTPPGYDDNHFDRVYHHLIKPACELAGYHTLRADEVQSANYIVIDIIKRIIDSDLVVCDLSSKNPNVMYELGIRQAFNLPSVLIKDMQTMRVFDIQGLRTYEYDETLRVDIIKSNIEQIATIINETEKNNNDDVNSLIQLLGIQKAEINDNVEISNETSIIMKSLREISQRITRIEENKFYRKLNIDTSQKVDENSYKLPNGESVKIGDKIYLLPDYKPLGTFLGWKENEILISVLEDGDEKTYIITADDGEFMSMTTGPF